MAARRKLSTAVEKSARKAGKRAARELGGRKKVGKAVQNAAGSAVTKPRKAGTKLVKARGGKAKLERALRKALAGASAIAVGARRRAIGGADA